MFAPKMSNKPQLENELPRKSPGLHEFTQEDLDIMKKREEEIKALPLDERA